MGQSLIAAQCTTKRDQIWNKFVRT